ncbi:hypothetical protein CRUP_031127 [Coryphaenoides rupestris]|nr:hypothetical protein CRUP_031127 [Coryphaenoides rupestris]
METTPPKVSLKVTQVGLPKAPRDCSDHLRRGNTTSSVYPVTPDPRYRSFPVWCDMDHRGGGWTVIQRRQDGSVSFNRTWAEYREGFGEINGGEFWLGNEKIHFLTRARDMVLRVELEDFDGVREYAEYGHFRVASERQRYRLTVGGYSGSAGDALRFSKSYDHHNRAFTTPDRDHDRYPSGNCGVYYSSGWWFDSCLAANLNGKYYVGSVASTSAATCDVLLRGRSACRRDARHRGPKNDELTVTASDCGRLRLRVRVSRECSDVAGGERDRRVLGQWHVVVDPFCAVRARLGCSVAVRPLDPHAVPDANRASVVVYGSSLDRRVELQHVNVHYDGHSKELSIVADGVTGDMSVELTTPVKSNLNIIAHGAGDVHIQHMECDVCKVQTGRGSCTLQSVKAVDVKKLQGTVMHVSTERGALKVKAIYAESTSISSSSGTVELGHVHGDATVKNVSGDVVIRAVSVRVPSSLRAEADLVGSSVEVSPEVTLQEAKRHTTAGQIQVTGYVNGNPGTEQRIKAEAAQGVVSLKTQSWFESLRLQGS